MKAGLARDGVHPEALMLAMVSGSQTGLTLRLLSRQRHAVMTPNLLFIRFEILAARLDGKKLNDSICPRPLNRSKLIYEILDDYFTIVC